MRQKPYHWNGTGGVERKGLWDRGDPLLVKLSCRSACTYISAFPTLAATCLALTELEQWYYTLSLYLYILSRLIPLFLSRTLFFRLTFMWRGHEMHFPARTERYSISVAKYVVSFETFIYWLTSCFRSTILCPELPIADNTIIYFN